MAAAAAAVHPGPVMAERRGIAGPFLRQAGVDPFLLCPVRVRVLCPFRSILDPGRARCLGCPARYALCLALDLDRGNHKMMTVGGGGYEAAAANLGEWIEGDGEERRDVEVPMSMLGDSYEVGGDYRHRWLEHY